MEKYINDNDINKVEKLISQGIVLDNSSHNSSINGQLMTNHAIAPRLYSSDGTMILNHDNIKSIIESINASVAEAEANVKALETNLLAKINNSWVASEANVYTSKVIDSINKTKKVIETLNYYLQHIQKH